MTAPTIDDRLRRARAATLATAAAAGHLAAVRVPDPTRDAEIRLSHELALLDDELADARGDREDRIERARIARYLAGVEEYVDAEGRLGTRPESAHGAADGSQLSRYSGGLVELSCPVDEDDEPEPAGPDAEELTREFVRMLGT